MKNFVKKTTGRIDSRLNQLKLHLATSKINHLKELQRVGFTAPETAKQRGLVDKSQPQFQTQSLSKRWGSYISVYGTLTPKPLKRFISFVNLTCFFKVQMRDVISRGYDYGEFCVFL